MTKTEEYLNICLNEVELSIDEVNKNLIIFNKERDSYSKDISENFYEMDEEERAKNGELLGEIEDSINELNITLKRLYRQLSSPFFGSFIFKQGEDIDEYYVGINNLVKAGNSIPLVCDWRAPISSVYYDYGIEKAKYLAPCGEVEGEVLGKKQYKIENGIVKSEVDTETTLSDNILIDALKENSSDKMKTIISTIQKEQNKIIRTDDNQNILVQGVAGSGKSSIALHRVAYLLYAHKDTLKAEDILIISPNKMFSEYISTVLPELGEENILQVDFKTLAESELKDLHLKIEERTEMLDDVLSPNHNRLNNIAYKNSYDFYESLKIFLNEYFKINFVPKDIRLGKNDKITADEIMSLYNKSYQNKTPAVRIDWICDYITDKFNLPSNDADINNRIKKQLFSFFSQSDVLSIYKEYLEYIGMEFSFNTSGMIRYEDMSGIWYIKSYFFGAEKENRIKYLIIDEMQDYSFVLYDILNQKFDCQKTVLGDINQCVEKIMTESDLNHLHDMLGGKIFNLKKTYRSTYQINEFAEKIKGLKFDKVEREGRPVETVIYTNEKSKIKKIKDIVAQKHSYKYTAILCKDTLSCEKLHALLNDSSIALLTNASEDYSPVMVMPIALSKGLEFDKVIAVDIDFNDDSFLGKNLAYIATTRALHELYFINQKTIK